MFKDTKLITPSIFLPYFPCNLCVAFTAYFLFMDLCKNAQKSINGYQTVNAFYIILIFRTFYLLCKYGHQYIIISIPDTSAIIALSITFFMKLSSDCPSHNTTIYLYSIYGRPPVIFFCHNSPIVYS